MVFSGMGFQPMTACTDAGSGAARCNAPRPAALSSRYQLNASQRLAPSRRCPRITRMHANGCESTSIDEQGFDAKAGLGYCAAMAKKLKEGKPPTPPAAGRPSSLLDTRVVYCDDNLDPSPALTRIMAS